MSDEQFATFCRILFGFFVVLVFALTAILARLSLILEMLES